MKAVSAVGSWGSSTLDRPAKPCHASSLAVRRVTARPHLKSLAVYRLGTLGLDCLLSVRSVFDLLIPERRANKFRMTLILLLDP